MMKWLEKHLPSVTMSVLVVNALVSFVVYVWSVWAQSGLIALLSGVMLVIAILLGSFIVLIPDDTQSQATERTLSMASDTFDHMREGLTYETCQATCELLLPETNAIAVGMTNRTLVLGYAGELAAEFPPGSPIHTKETLAVLESGQLQMFSHIHAIDGSEDPRSDNLGNAPAGLIVPLIVRDATVGTIKFYYRQSDDIDRTQVVIARGLGQLLSTQLNAFALDRQSELTVRAEVKALQAQINPHFLFNTLNTISSFMRTDPERARALLREFAVFYRQTLENSADAIPLSRELEQTERYLTFEIARFGEDRIIESSTVEPGCEDVPVPAFLIQPIVENSVRHAMREEGPLHIEVHVETEGDDVLISVTDDGVGMDNDVAQSLLEGASATPQQDQFGETKGEQAGTRIALKNVADRVERFYGEGSGVEVVSKPGEGTSVTMRLANAAIKN